MTSRHIGGPSPKEHSSCSQCPRNSTLFDESFCDRGTLRAEKRPGIPSAKAGLGFLILQSSYHLDSAALFVTIILAALLGFALFGAVCVVERLVCTWEQVEA